MWRVLFLLLVVLGGLALTLAVAVGINLAKAVTPEPGDATRPPAAVPATAPATTAAVTLPPATRPAARARPERAARQE
jgi:hypothetical protein